MVGVRTAVVTGGAGGIGLATISRLLNRGLNVMMIDANAEQAHAAARHFETDKLAVSIVDVMHEPAVARSVEETLQRFGRVDILVNVAGGAGPNKLHQIETIEPDAWDLVINLNVRSVYLYCRAVMPHMRQQRFGRIVNISSTLAYGEKGPPTTVAARLPYATAKSALLGFTSQLAKDVASDGITVNALLPGLILGERGTRIRERFEALPDEQRASIMGLYPIGRPGDVDEVAAAIDFLVSEAAGYITGTAIPVDGGYL
jgi:NAD(P)-dependent dehydrogenase (short-subunit alcohol dehydrogenase family)